MSDEAKARAFNFLQKYLNTAKRDSKSTNDKDVEKKATKDLAKKDDDWLTQKAIAELQKEISINKVKRKAFGSVTVPPVRTNKRFLATTLSQCLSHNNRETNKHTAKSTDKLRELDRTWKLRLSQKKFGERKHEFKKPEKKSKKSKKSRPRSRSSSSSDSD